MVPMGDWAKTRLKNLSETDKSRDESKVRSGFGKNVSNWLERDMAYPTNVLHFATECYNKKHSAVFPKSLPVWFIKLFTKEHDWVLDPFAGSGTTAEVAQKMNRNSVGIEILPEYCSLAKERTTVVQLRLCENKAEYESDNPKTDSDVCRATHPGIS
jgi:DNA modification methylase